jgi:hypothetical protein
MSATGADDPSWATAFNTPIECGLRSVVLLAECFPETIDIQRLVNYDYLLVHSGDVDGGPESIHPATPHRSGELLVRRPMIEAGIKLFMSKSVIECQMTLSGMLYVAGEWSVAFLDSIESEYANELKDRAHWVVKRFSGFSDPGLAQFMRENWSHWGAEFEYQSLVQDSEL